MSSENRISRHSQFFKVLLEKIDSRIALFTLEGDLIYANKLFYEMLGMDTSIEINFSSPTWIHPEDNQLYKEKLTEAISEGESFSEYRCVTSSGDVITMSARNLLMRDSGYNSSMVVSITHNISDFKQREHEFIDSKKFLETLIERIPTGVFVKDAETRKYIIWNKTCEELYNISKEKVIGRTDEELFNNYISGKFREKDDLVISQRRQEEYEEVIYTPTGHRYNLIKVKIPFISDDNRDLIIGIMRDVTQDRSQERELRQAREKALESDRLKTAFLANMSHEIRTPLNSILGFADLLDESQTTELDKKTYLSIIRNNGKRLLSLINDIIDISKIESKQLELHWTMVNINNTIRNLLASFELQKSKLNKEHLRLFSTMPLSDDKAYINTDQIRFEQIFSNLISNALKFTDSGFVEFGYKLVKNELVFFVTDSGQGIQHEDLDGIFTRFMTTSKEETSSSSAGLGLTICKELVELLNGKIWAESALGKGSTFYFTLPYEQNISTKHSSEIVTNLIPDTSGSSDWNVKKVLITEDNEDIRFYVKNLLKPTGINIVFAENGQEAIDYCTENTDIDLVLMDIDLPNVNGKEAFTKIHAMCPSLSIIAETAYAMVGDEEKLLKHGFNAYLAKPFNRQQLFDVMRRFL